MNALFTLPTDDRTGLFSVDTDTHGPYIHMSTVSVGKIIFNNQTQIYFNRMSIRYKQHRFVCAFCYFRARFVVVNMNKLQAFKRYLIGNFYTVKVYMDSKKKKNRHFCRVHMIIDQNNRRSSVPLISENALKGALEPKNELQSKVRHSNFKYRVTAFE